MTTIPRGPIAPLLAMALLVGGCSDAAEGEARPAGDRAEAPAPPGLGTATVEVNGTTFDLVVIGCMEADQDPSGLLEFGPMFAWQRLIDQGDHVSLMLSSEFGSGEGAWFTAEGEEPTEFIARDGRSFRGSTSVENPATDETGTLTFEARYP